MESKTVDIVARGITYPIAMTEPRRKGQRTPEHGEPGQGNGYLLNAPEDAAMSSCGKMVGKRYTPLRRGEALLMA